MTSTVDTFIYLQRDIEQSFQRLETSSFVDPNLLHHISCTIDDLEEIHRLLSTSNADEITTKSSSSVSFVKIPSADEREVFLRQNREKLDVFKRQTPINEDQQLRNQDEHLDTIHKSIVSLKNLSQNIHQEIDDHLRVLDTLGTEMIESQNRVENLHRKTKNFLLNSSDGVAGHTCLFSIAVLLFFLIIILILFV